MMELRAQRPGKAIAVNTERLLERIETLAAIGRQADGACARLALTDDDAAGRALVIGWMKDAGMSIEVDRIGNIIATLPGDGASPPVMTGSHIDTVATGGRFDGNLGVLAGIEVVQSIREAGLKLRRPIAVSIFTNEEGVRFQPDMMGSLVYAGGLALDTALDTRDERGVRLGDELARLGYAGEIEPGAIRPAAFVELHIEQGPVLDNAGEVLGAVEKVQGISWQEITIAGKSNHAGTTPMSMRHDAAHCAAEVVTFIRRLSEEFGGAQVATAGHISVSPNLINVIAREAVLSVDLRNTDDAALALAEQKLTEFLAVLATREGVNISTKILVRTAPVEFDQKIVALIEANAARMGMPIRRMASGAGHDAQMIARIAPTAMIFIPSIGGISHNPREDTRPEHIGAGLELLAHTLVALADE